ncbi:nucleotidyltransferase domain-containing protein [Sphingomonas aliaeris]|uniref:Nucleotidyltransferase domain-containing protein n=1 Tax=Sphingomonas aliaeris TaxID=2759526 RepID=A0A974NUU6_9SPHN|nr:nucleotidyltransferase domain-containing protein [Sphingomonas aliaeris]QQV77227.1 nucleotidyltransferase domain-containing protein [Sphingomonas aliaeris]
MRLRTQEVQAIKASVAEAFGPSAIVRLFGSRIDDTLRGGDIDLHLEVDDGSQDYRKAAAFRWRLFDRIDEQKVDLVFRVRGRPLRPIDEIAYEEGIVL